MQITMTGRGVEITEAIDAYVNKKLNGLEKFFEGIIRANVVLGRETNHHQKGDVFFVEATIAVPGADVFSKQTAGDVYAAVDLLHDHLASELKKHKEKLHGNDKKKKTTARDNKEYQE